MQFKTSKYEISISDKGRLTVNGQILISRGCGYFFSEEHIGESCSLTSGGKEPRVGLILVAFGKEASSSPLFQSDEIISVS